MQDNSVTIAAVGDTVCRAADGGDPFRFTRDILGRANLRFVNLETVVVSADVGRPGPKWIHLRTDPNQLRYLPADVVNLANNHVFDYGPEPFAQMLNALVMKEVQWTGVDWGPESDTVVFVRNSLTIGFIGFNAYSISAGRFTVKGYEDQEATRQAVATLSERVDVTVVSLHWGTEHAPHPSPAQVEFAHSLIDTGACLILGHHPHRPQAVERYKNGLIAYSLGNFNFVQPDVKGQWFNQLSMILLATVDRSGVSSYETVPAWIDKETGVPKPARQYLGLLKSDVHVSWGQWYEEIGATYIRQTLRSFAVTIPRYGLVRIKKLWWWLRQAHTWRAVGGMLRGWYRGICQC